MPHGSTRQQAWRSVAPFHALLSLLKFASSPFSILTRLVDRTLPRQQHWGTPHAYRDSNCAYNLLGARRLLRRTGGPSRAERRYWRSRSGRTRWSCRDCRTLRSSGARWAGRASWASWASWTKRRSRRCRRFQIETFSREGASIAGVFSLNPTIAAIVEAETKWLRENDLGCCR
jgi:hypothetical protein